MREIAEEQRGGRRYLAREEGSAGCPGLQHTHKRGHSIGDGLSVSNFGSTTQRLLTNAFQNAFQTGGGNLP